MGTMAHSLIMSFEKESDIDNCRMLGDVDLLPACLKLREELGWTQTNLGELYAFISFATAYPDAFSALIDSYHTINSGIKNYIILAIILKQNGKDARGIRLDSGDLTQLSKDCRSLMTQTGNKYGYDFSKMSIVASNDINEDRLREFNAVGHEMNVYGIGTNLVTC